MPSELDAMTGERPMPGGPRQLGLAVLAACVPLVLYVFSASGHGFWLDSAEFGAAAVSLDIPHPPGHPLFGLWSKPFTWLPLGPLPFRVAIAQAVAAALALFFTQRAIERTLQRLGAGDALARGLLALAATWVLAGAYGFWFQAVRAEVYALEAMLVCASLERLSAIELDGDTARPPDPRPFYRACLALGLGLANHHFIAVLALPALGYTLVVLLRAHGVRVFATALLAGAVGLVCYLYLPLRAASEPPMDLGHPVTLRDFFWVVSARVYARNIGTQALQPLGERFADLAVIVVENFTPVVPLLALVGAYALLRRRRTWPLAYLWIVTVVVSLGGRAFLNPVRANPDVLGYMMPGFAALLALAAVGGASPFVLLHSRVPWRARSLVRTLGCLLALLGLSQFWRESERSSLHAFHASDDFDELRRRTLPTRSLLVLTTPDVVFRHWEGAAVEQLRADITMLPLPFVGYGATHEVLSRRHPELETLIASYQQRGSLPIAELQRLAATRPVFVELDTAAAWSLAPFVVPDGLLYRVWPVAPARADVLRAARARDAVQRALVVRLGANATETETQKQLLWTRYVEALYYGAHGARAPALQALEAVRALSPTARELDALEYALLVGQRDMTPFLLHRSTRTGH